MKLEYADGATPIDADEAEALIPTHLTTREELDRWEYENIAEAMEWLDAAKPKDVLNEQFIKQVHGRMFGNVWKWAGQFRRSDKNIGVPWSQVPVSLRNLCDDGKLWVDSNEETADQTAVRFHHRLVSIHAFPNGNGRHARLVADTLLENVLGSARFTWGNRELAIAGDVRRAYIGSLRAADDGDYDPLLRFARS